MGKMKHSAEHQWISWFMDRHLVGKLGSVPSPLFDLFRNNMTLAGDWIRLGALPGRPRGMSTRYILIGHRFHRFAKVVVDTDAGPWTGIYWLRDIHGYRMSNMVLTRITDRLWIDRAVWWVVKKVTNTH